MLGGVAEFERELMLERQREGIKKAKAAGRYKGRTPTARAKKTEILDLHHRGKRKSEIATELNIGLSSVYRIIAESDKSPAITD
jgi:DNA invertase Pin-like site-specific DNA recombinase